MEKLKIIYNANDLKPYAGFKWITISGNCGFWQQVTKNYTTINRLKRYNKQYLQVK